MTPKDAYEMFPYHRRYEYEHPSYDLLLQALMGRSDSLWELHLKVAYTKR